MDSNFRNIPLSESVDSVTDKPTEKKLKTEPETIINEPIIDTETIQYKPLEYHWFYTTYLTDKLLWIPMSHKDSTNLEKVYKKNSVEIKQLRKQTAMEQCEHLKKHKQNLTVSIKGGRFEIDLIELVKRPIYWNDAKRSEVRRCLWFYKENNDQRFLPYDEDYSEFLEIEYEKTINTNMFHKRIDYSRQLPQLEPMVTSEEAFVFHSTTIMLHFTQATMLDEYGNLNSDAKRPRVVKRGLNDVVDKIDPDETENIDHLCFVVHGIGDGCDLRFRPIVECVDDFRDIGSYMIHSHLKCHIDSLQINGRVEFLPISWHNELHGDPTGVDNRLKPITLSSIPKLRQYSNTTILDVLFYTSPIYCQTIINKVGNELNRLSQIFLERNPYFSGKISLIGHSLGSLILFDLLSHQFKIDQKDTLIPPVVQLDSEPTDKSEHLEDFLKRLNLTEYQSLFEAEKITTQNLSLLTEADLVELGIPLGPRRILLNEFKHDLFRKEQEEVEKKIKSNLETLKRHESDQHNQIELNAMNLAQKNTADYFKYGLAGTGQLVVKYPQLNFKVAKFFALGSPIAMFLTVRGIEKLGTDFKFPTCDEFFNIFHPFDPVAYRFEPLICAKPILKPVLMPHHKGRKRMHLELRENLTKVGEDLKQRMYDQINKAWTSLSDFAKLPKVLTNNLISTAIESVQIEGVNVSEGAASATVSPVSELNSNNTIEHEIPEVDKIKIDLGKVNQGKRIDYVLQERPIESFNEYLFALASHACYWESEDTLLMIIKEMYGLAHALDSNTELQLTEQQQKASSWLTQAAAATLSFNIKKTL